MLAASLTGCGQKTTKTTETDSDSLRPPIVKYLVDGQEQSNDTEIYYIGDPTDRDTITLYAYPLRDDTIHAAGADRMDGDGLSFPGNVVKAELEKDGKGNYIVRSIENVDSRFTHTLAALIGSWVKKPNKKDVTSPIPPALTLYGDGRAEGDYTSWEFAEPPTSPHTQQIILHPANEETEDDTLNVDLDRMRMGDYRKKSPQQ
ncbi:MAG: hypothetical protein K6A82_01365 [Prevotella sp.]|nr:hypothetical protein [Prevotella sp.]